MHCQQGVYTKNPGRPNIDPFLIDGILYFKRNPNAGQIYRLKRLQASLHLSNSIAVAHEIDFRLRFLINGHNCIPITLSVEQTQNVTIEEIGLFIHNTDDAIPNINESNLLNDNTYMDANLPPIPTDPNIPINTSRANVSQNCSAEAHSSKPPDDSCGLFSSSDSDSSEDEADRRVSIRGPPNVLPFPETPRVTLKPVHNIYDPILRKDDLPPKIKQAPPKKSQPLQETRMHIEKAIDLGLL